MTVLVFSLKCSLQWVSIIRFNWFNLTQTEFRHFQKSNEPFDLLYIPHWCVIIWLAESVSLTILVFFKTELFICFQKGVPRFHRIFLWLSKLFKRFSRIWLRVPLGLNITELDSSFNGLDKAFSHSIYTFYLFRRLFCRLLLVSTERIGLDYIGIGRIVTTLRWVFTRFFFYRMILQLSSYRDGWSVVFELVVTRGPCADVDDSAVATGRRSRGRGGHCASDRTRCRRRLAPAFFSFPFFFLLSSIHFSIPRFRFLFFFLLQNCEVFFLMLLHLFFSELCDILVGGKGRRRGLPFFSLVPYDVIAVLGWCHVKPISVRHGAELGHEANYCLARFDSSSFFFLHLLLPSLLHLRARMWSSHELIPVNSFSRPPTCSPSFGNHSQSHVCRIPSCRFQRSS